MIFKCAGTPLSLSVMLRGIFSSNASTWMLMFPSLCAQGAPWRSVGSLLSDIIICIVCMKDAFRAVYPEPALSSQFPPNGITVMLINLSAVVSFFFSSQCIGDFRICWDDGPSEGFPHRLHRHNVVSVVVSVT